MTWLRIGAIAVASLVLASCRSIDAPMRQGTLLHKKVTTSNEHAFHEPPTVASANTSNTRTRPVTIKQVHYDNLSSDILTTQSNFSSTESFAPAETEELFLAPTPTPLPLPSPAPIDFTSIEAVDHCKTCHTPLLPRINNCGSAVICAPPQGRLFEAHPYLVCDGGDLGSPVKAKGEFELVNLTEGDTAARYRPVDDADDVRVTISNRVCVYAPRFASVRHITVPHEDASPSGLAGVTLDSSTRTDGGRQPVWESEQRIQPSLTRDARSGLGLLDRNVPLEVAKDDLPSDEVGTETTRGHAVDTHAALSIGRDKPVLAIRFEVPVAWTRVTGAQVMLMGRPAEVISADRGTAILRIEEPGRAQLTISKQAGGTSARENEELDFTIYVLNSGDRPLSDVILSDALPKRLELIASSPDSSLPAEFSTEPASDGSVTLTWKFTNTLAPGQSGFVRFRTIVH